MAVQQCLFPLSSFGMALDICVCFWNELFGGLCLLILLLYLNCRHIFCLHYYMAIYAKNVCLVFLIAWVLIIQVPCSVRV